MGLATKLNDSDLDIRTLHRAYDEHDVHQSRIVVGDPRHIVYLGVTELSVNITFDDGSQLRITNPNFTKGLELHSYEKDT